MLIRGRSRVVLLIMFSFWMEFTNLRIYYYTCINII
jgi:hypothetical protein